MEAKLRNSLYKIELHWIKIIPMVLCALSFTDTDDADAEEGYVFNRFYADCMFMNNPIDWDDVI